MARAFARSSFYFNCTIQELKLALKLCLGDDRQFQLHHTGIKTLWRMVNGGGGGRFQLHHTGIKTFFSPASEECCSRFQLHHTGIKTMLNVLVLIPISADFNCTIQELKPVGVFEGFSRFVNFNCTIQELKLGRK